MDVARMILLQIAEDFHGRGIPYSTTATTDPANHNPHEFGTTRIRLSSGETVEITARYLPKEEQERAERGRDARR